MAKSELMINIGANGSQAKKEIKEVKKAGIDLTQEIQAKNNEATKSVIGMVAPMALAVQGLMFLIGGIADSIKKYFAQGEVFVKWGEKAEISAHSVAYLKAEADAAGVSAKEFEQAMSDLGSGKTSLAKLREEWKGLGDEIKTAANAEENFRKLARSKNFEIFGDGATNFFGSIAEGTLEMLGSGGAQLAAVERAAYEGLSLEEAMMEGLKARRGWHAPVTRGRMERAYEAVVKQKAEDEERTQKRLNEETAKKLASADLSDDAKMRLFKETTGVEMAASAIDELAASIKTRDEKLSEAIKDTAEEEKKAREEEKKRRDDNKKIVEDGEKLGYGIKDAFTAGGGLIGNAVYGLKSEDWAKEQVKLMRQQTELNKAQATSLAAIESAIVED